MLKNYFQLYMVVLINTLIPDHKKMLELYRFMTKAAQKLNFSLLCVQSESGTNVGHIIFNIFTYTKRKFCYTFAVFLTCGIYF